MVCFGLNLLMREVSRSLFFKTILMQIKYSWTWWLCKNVSWKIFREPKINVYWRSQNHTVNFQCLFIWEASCTKSAWRWHQRKVVMFHYMKLSRQIEWWADRLKLEYYKYIHTRIFINWSFLFKSKTFLSLTLKWKKKKKQASKIHRRWFWNLCNTKLKFKYGKNLDIKVIINYSKKRKTFFSST